MTVPAKIEASYRMWAALLGVDPNLPKPKPPTPGLQRVGVQLHRMEEAGNGIVTGYASTFGHTFTAGMFGEKVRMKQGALASTIRARRVFPVGYEHVAPWMQPPIGHTTFVSEDSHGVKFSAQFYLDSDPGRQVFRAIKAKALTEWSIGFNPIKWTDTKVSGEWVREYEEIDLVEISSVLRGANPRTSTEGTHAGPTPSEVMAIKRRFAKLDREMRAGPEAVRIIRELEATVGPDAPADVKRRLAAVKRGAGL